jgi:hypothetical protein
LACGRCNGRDNKSNKVVDFSLIHFPHLNNTFLSFEYHEGGYVKVNPALAGISQTKAENLINLVGLDKIPGNPKYPILIRMIRVGDIEEQLGNGLLENYRIMKLPV